MEIYARAEHCCLDAKKWCMLLLPVLEVVPSFIVLSDRKKPKIKKLKRNTLDFISVGERKNYGIFC